MSDQVIGPSYIYRSELVRIIDGDTYIMELDLGFHIKAEVRVRLNGIDCPEMRTSEGESAALAAQVIFANREILVRTYKDRMTFERWVCDIWIRENKNAPWVSVKDQLVRGGHVKDLGHPSLIDR